MDTQLVLHTRKRLVKWLTSVKEGFKIQPAAPKSVLLPNYYGEVMELVTACSHSEGLTSLPVPMAAYSRVDEL